MVIGRSGSDSSPGAHQERGDCQRNHFNVGNVPQNIGAHLRDGLYE